jgi:glycosyltransferase involved in cell wall biosynthesis
MSKVLRTGQKLTIASVAYPFAPVSEDPVGGAEQILSRLDRALCAAGHRSVVIAQRGSSVAGELRVVDTPGGEVDDTARASVHARVRQALAQVIASDDPDVIHFHGIDFADYLPEGGPPCLVTLHLPLSWYPERALRPERTGVLLVPVSCDQARRAPPGVELARPIENGVPIPSRPGRKRDFALTLGRICSEKGTHEAVEAARAAGSRLLVAGSVFPYAEHRRYWRERVRPRLDGARRWIGRIGGRRKQSLLGAAKCLLVPSRAPETSSLVAMEALAVGTPVIAYCNGALPDVIDHGRTGFLVKDVGGMADAIRAVGHIDTAACRLAARERFPLHRMIEGYFDQYRRMARLAERVAPEPVRNQHGLAGGTPLG